MVWDWVSFFRILLAPPRAIEIRNGRCRKRRRCVVLGFRGGEAHFHFGFRLISLVRRHGFCILMAVPSKTTFYGASSIIVPERSPA